MQQVRSPFVRRRRRNTRGVVAGALVLSLLAAACGDDDEEGSETSVEESAVESPTTLAETTAPVATEPPASEPSATDSGDTEPPSTDTVDTEPPATEPPESAPATSPPDDTEYDLEATLNVTTDGRPQQLDPHLEPNTGNRGYTTVIYDTLTDIKERGVIRPMLATEWEVSDDGLTVTLQLRDDVTFHDGTPLDAEAVTASLERAKTIEGSTLLNDLTAIESIEASGPYEVTFNLSTPDPKLLTVLGGPAGMILNPTAIAAGNDFSANPDGSGAYVVTEHIPEESVTYERADGEYWDTRGAKLAGFTMSFVGDFRVAINGVQAGQYDAAWIIGSNQLIQSALGDDDLQVVDFDPTSIIGLYLNNQADPLNDKRVRQAISYAVDREGITNAIFDGGADCVPASQNYPMPGEPLYIEGFDPYPYDPEKATALIAEAGATGKSIEMYDIGTTASRDLGQALQPMLQAIGLEAELIGGSTATVAELQKRTIDAIVLTSVALPHPLTTLTRYWLPGGAYHMADGEDANLQTLVAQAMDPAAGEDELEETYDAIAREMADLSLIMPVCAPVQHVLARADIVGLDAAELSRLNMRYVGVEAGD